MEIKGPEYYAQWRADQAKKREAPPAPAAPAQRPRERAPVNMEAQRAHLMGQIRETQSLMDEATRAAERFRRDGLPDYAERKEASVQTYKFRMKQLREDLGKLAS